MSDTKSQPELSLAIPTVTVTLSSLSPSASLFFIDLFYVLYLCHHLFLNPKRDSHRRPPHGREEPSESLHLPLSLSSSIDRSVVGDSITVRETITMSSSQINSATSFEVWSLLDSQRFGQSWRSTPARKKDVSYESDMKDAVGVYLPLTYAAVKSIQEEVFPKSCLLNFEIPSSPWTNKVLSSIALWLFTAAKAPKDTLDLYLHGHGKF
ncbi:Cation efflux family protein [Prunus dulcis]|uniref:Cation efflux family protein n=1 Tax=Prunus dulcis TaxID=3755 RepID=A0A4Y1REG5_PRUDU|nr:Cation efflux family protein [Prunus dulcis]